MNRRHFLQLLTSAVMAVSTRALCQAPPWVEEIKPPAFVSLIDLMRERGVKMIDELAQAYEDSIFPLDPGLCHPVPLGYVDNGGPTPWSI